MEIESIIWRVVTPSMRPIPIIDQAHSDGALFLLKQGWMVEVTSLDEMGRFDLRDLDISEPELWASLC